MCAPPFFLTPLPSIHLIHLTVPSSLRWLAPNAGPQVPVDSSSSAVTSWQARPLFYVPDPIVSGAPSRSSAFDFAFY